MSLRLKTILGVATIEAILLVLLVSMTLDYLRSTNYDGLVKRASTTAKLFATTTQDAVLSYDLASLESFVDEVMTNPDLVYARVIGSDGTVFAQAGDPNVLSRPFVADALVEQIHDDVFDAFAEIAEGGISYGRVEVGLDIHSITEKIAEAQRWSMLIAGGEMALVAMFSFILGAYLTSQLDVLTKAAKQIAKGDLDIQVPVRGKDEIAEVATTFNIMAKNLQFVSLRRDQFENELKELNRSLEQRVESRTNELVAKNNELVKANHEIKEAQAKLLQSEKMASVGVLAAGVAHEINNPIGFVLSNIKTLEEYLRVYGELIEEYEKLSTLETEEARAAQHAKIKALAEENDLEFITEDVEGLIADSIEGTERVRDIVKGLKEFSHVDQTAEFRESDLNDCIKTTLRMAHNELKYKCEVKQNLADLPLIHCSPGQINQVLLNLVLNACHAIEDKGIISVESRKVGNNIEISVQDTGKGIEPEVIPKLFDPFFTTKPVGQGTGLGLAVSYSIMEEHGGSIEVESTVGEGSRFTLVLPMEKEAQDEQNTLPA